MQTDFRPRQIYEQVADEIRAGIISGVYQPGSRLPSERDLAQRLMVGRPAVREAIGALQNEGMVITRLGSGTYVAEQTVDPVLSQTGEPKLDADFSPISILEVRLLIEPAIVRLAARRGKRNTQAEHYLALMAGVTDVNDSNQQVLWSESDRLFHRQIAVMTNDALLVKIADKVAESMAQPLWNRLRDDGIYDASRIQLYVAEHRLIYEAILCGDEDAAAFYVENHLKRVHRDITTHE